VISKTATRWAAVAAALVVVLCPVIGVSTPAWAAVGTYYSVCEDPNHGCYDPSNPYDNPPSVMDIRGRSHADRAQAVLYTWHGGNNQRWTKRAMGVGEAGGTYYEIINTESGKCLDKSQDTPDADGNLVYQYTCRGTTNQLWLPRGNYRIGRWFELVNLSDGRCLDVNGPSLQDGTILHVWHCYDTWSQLWNIDDN